MSEWKTNTFETGFIGLNDPPDSNIEKSYEPLNHKNHSSDFIELVNYG